MMLDSVIRRRARWLWSLLAITVAFPGSALARELGSVTFAPCTLSSTASATAVEAQCGTISVPENHADPQGRHIDLAIAWVPAREEALPDPVFMLAGGPGQSALEGYPQLADAFSDTNKRHHIILLDQRGTGASNPLICKNAQGESAVMAEGTESPEAAAAFAESCRDELSDHADLRYYTTTDAIQDLDAVRAALGAEQINLIGISYGTRVAQHYAARYPAQTRTVLLDSAVPNELILGSEHARNLEDSLDQQFARCADLPACVDAFGNPREQLNTVLQLARDASPMVRFRNAVSGEWQNERLSEDRLVTLVRLFAYAPVLAAMLPMTLHDAAHDNPESLMALSQMIGSQLSEQIMHGMQLSVMCTEDAQSLTANANDVDTLLGTALVDFLKAQCAVWPRGELPDAFHKPLHSDLPILILAGEFDPVTPVRYGEQIVKGLDNGRLLVLSGQGHNVIPAGCMPKLMARFIDSADAKALDSTCLDALPYAPPFTGYYGWEP